MANFGRVFFLHFFPKTTLNASKWQFLLKNSTFVGFRGNFAVLRLLEGFLAISEESRPPLKWPILGGSTFFNFSQKCLFTELGPIPVWNFDASLLFRENFFKFLLFINADPETFSHPNIAIAIFGYFLHYHTTLMITPKFALLELLSQLKTIQHYVIVWPKCFVAQVRTNLYKIIWLLHTSVAGGVDWWKNEIDGSIFTSEISDLYY